MDVGTLQQQRCKNAQIHQNTFLSCTAMQTIFHLSEIPKAADTLLAYAKEQSSRVIALNGQMGAGKTTFTAAFLKALGSKDIANSPTFSIINQYRDSTGKPVYHMDWYRLRDEEEALQAGVEDCLYSGYWCLVEWPEKAERLLPENTIIVHLTTNEDGSRTLST
jgi:tRNA threonylcarbamoyladenosine biosynthesis protein TsaE